MSPSDSLLASVVFPHVYVQCHVTQEWGHSSDPDWLCPSLALWPGVNYSLPLCLHPHLPKEDEQQTVSKWRLSCQVHSKPSITPTDCHWLGDTIVEKKPDSVQTGCVWSLAARHGARGVGESQVGLSFWKYIFQIQNHVNAFPVRRHKSSDSMDI